MRPFTTAVPLRAETDATGAPRSGATTNDGSALGTTAATGAGTAAGATRAGSLTDRVIAAAVVSPPTRTPITAPSARIAPARLRRTPMISRVPQPGHLDVPSDSGRAHAGQVKTCASASPIARSILEDPSFVEWRRFVVIVRVFSERVGAGTCTTAIRQARAQCAGTDASAHPARKSRSGPPYVQRKVRGPRRHARTKMRLCL